jgi:hypothetical protein
VTLAATPTVPSSPQQVAPVGARAATEAGLSLAVEVGFLLFLGAALLGLAFATIPANVLSGISVRLVERRQDIGLVLAGISASAAMYVIFMAT